MRRGGEKAARAECTYAGAAHKHFSLIPMVTRHISRARLLCQLLSRRTAGKRLPVYLLYATCRLLNCHVVPALAASFLVSFEALHVSERRGAWNHFQTSKWETRGVQKPRERAREWGQGVENTFKDQQALPVCGSDAARTTPYGH